MSESRAAGWPSGSPTAAQLKEFFAQIESGKIDKDRLQSFLRSKPDAYELMRNFDIHELELSVRAYNLLKRVGIDTIGDLVAKSDDDLSRIPNMGRKPIEEIKERLANHGLALEGEEPPAKPEDLTSDDELTDERAVLIDLFTLVDFVNRRLDLPHEIAEVERQMARDEEHIRILPADGVAAASDHKAKLEGRLTELKKEQDALSAKIDERRGLLARELKITT